LVAVLNTHQSHLQPRWEGNFQKRAMSRDSVLYLVLPNPQNTPAGAAQTSRHEQVPLAVAFDFITPITAIPFWLAQVLRAAVPKAAIHKNRKPIIAKHKIRTTQRRQMSSPAFDAMPPENLNEAQFGGLVPSGSHRCHDLRPFFLADRIGHPDLFNKAS